MIICTCLLEFCSLEEDISGQIAKIDKQLKPMQQELLATVNSKNTGDELGMEIRRILDEKQTLQTKEAFHQDMKVRVDEMMSFLNHLSCGMAEYEEQYVRALLEKITVYDDHFIVEFKSGIEIQSTNKCNTISPQLFPELWFF